MKRLLIAPLMALLLATSVHAQNLPHTRVSPAGDLVSIEIPSITGTASSAWYDVSSYGSTTHLLTFTYITQPTGVTVKLQCSTDAGATSSDLGSSTSTTGATIQATGTCNAVRVNISGLTGSINIRPVYRGATVTSSSTLGTVKIDQTTPGTTNGVALEQIGTTTAVATANGSDTISNTAINGLNSSAFNYVFNNTTWARLRDAIGASGTTGSGVLASAAFSFDGTNYGPMKNVGGFADGLNTGPIMTIGYTMGTGSTYNRPRDASIGNNIVGTGLTVGAPYGQYNTPQSNSSAPLGNITTAQFANLQTDISGRLITTPGVTQMAWQAAQVSGVTATTTTRNTFTGLGQFNSCYVLLRTTTTGTATGTLNIYVQDSADGGTTWDDLISSLAITFGAATATQRFTLSGQVVGATITTAASTGITQGSAVVVETLAAGSARQGPWGDQIRIREKVSGPSGSPVGVTYKIDAVCKN